MAALSASVLWCGVAGADAVSAAADSGNGGNGASDAQEAQEFRCSGCNIMELILAGRHRMALKSPVQLLQWTHEDFLSCDGNNATERPGACGSKTMMSHVEEFAARRGLMRMLQQEDHEVFSSLSAWRSAPSATFAPGWFFSETFDGRLLLLPFYHRAQAAAESAEDVTLLLHMDASRLKNLEHAVTSWGGPVSVVVIVYVAARVGLFACNCVTLAPEDMLQTLASPSSPSTPFCNPPTQSHRVQASTSPALLTPLSTILSTCVCPRLVSPQHISRLFYFVT
jgi:hypothetical protein